MLKAWLTNQDMILHLLSYLGSNQPRYDNRCRGSEQDSDTQGGENMLEHKTLETRVQTQLVLVWGSLPPTRSRVMFGSIKINMADM